MNNTSAIIEAIILICISATYLVSAITFFFGNFKLLYVFDVRSLKDEDRPSFSKLIGLVYLLPSIVGIGLGISLFYYFEEYYLFVCGGTLLGVIIVSYILTRLVIKKFIGKVIDR